MNSKICPDTTLVAIPPPTFYYYRLRTITFTGFLWYTCEHCTGGTCRISLDFDRKKWLEKAVIQAEYPPPEGIDRLLGSTFRAGTKERSIYKYFYEPIRLSYDNASEILRFGGSKFPGMRKHKLQQERLITSPTRFIFARGFAQEATIKENPQKYKPLAGFIDVLFGDKLIPVLFVLAPPIFKKVDPLRKYMAGVVVRSMGGGTSSGLVAVEILMADLGDRGWGLREFIEFAYDPGVQCGKKAGFHIKSSLIPPGLGSTTGVDLQSYVKLWFLLNVIHEALRGSIERILGWPTATIAIIGDFENFRQISFNSIPSTGIASLIQAFRESSERLGVRPSRLAWGLKELLRCVSGSGRKISAEERFSGLASLALETIDATLRGIVDEDLLVMITRSLASSDLGSIPEGCRNFLQALQWG